MPVPDTASPLPAAKPGPKPASALAPFRYPAFRAIWTANLASNIGSMIQSVGAAWLMTELTTSHLLVALVQASATIPILLLGMFAGAIADNFDRRRVMLAAQTGMLIVSAALAALSYSGNIGPWSLLALTLLVGMGTALNGPAWQASVRMQVSKADLPHAVSLNAVSMNLARSVGPAVGGVLISLWDTSLAFAINAISYLGMIVVLAMWKPDAAPPRKEPMLAAIGRGIRFCASSSPIRKVLLRGLVLGTGAAALQALLPSVAKDRLLGTEIDYGLMLGGFGLGSILAALRVSHLRRRFGSEPVVVGATVLMIVGLVGLALAATPAAAIPAAFIGGMGWVSAMTSLNVAMQLRSPEDILGRCLSMYQAVTFGSMAVGAWIWGLVADMAGLGVALNMAAAWLGATLILHFVAPMPTREEGRLDIVPESKS